MSVKIYGIKNCDTMKKAFKWLDENGVSYEFHDYKKDAPPQKVLSQAVAEHGWDKMINQRGTTWRKLSDDVKGAMGDQSAIQVAIENPSIIKRPLLVHGDTVYLGFDENEYSEIFG